MKKTTTSYTYIDLANDIKAILTGQPTKGTPEMILAKAEALRATNERKQIYNATTEKKSKAKGPNAETVELVAMLERTISTEPLTADDINTLLGTDYAPIRISGAIKFMDGISKCKVKREKVSPKGLKRENEYTAYFRATATDTAPTDTE